MVQTKEEIITKAVFGIYDSLLKYVFSVLQLAVVNLVANDKWMWYSQTHKIKIILSNDLNMIIAPCMLMQIRKNVLK